MISAALEKLGSRERLGLGLAILFVAALFVDWLVVRPLVVRWKDVDAEIVAKRDSIRLNRRILAWEPDVRKEFEQVQALLGSSGSAEESVQELKARIDELAEKDGVTIQTRERGQSRAVAGSEEHALDIEQFESEPKNFLEFLRDVQQANGLVRVSRMSVGPKEGSSQIAGSMRITRLVVAPQEKPGP
jgi:hypothetical protein